MQDGFLTLFEAAKALVNYIDTESVFDRAAAGGCSGMDYYLSDPFYDLIVNTKQTINEVQNDLGPASTDNEIKAKVTKLLGAAKTLLTHIVKEPAFDKVNELGPVGIETYQSDNFIKIIQQADNAVKAAESELRASELQ